MSLTNGINTTQTQNARSKRQWWKEASVYQIYPASFKDSNGDGVGDIPGIISELDYIKSLGVDVVWLSPILQSPQVDMGYDISDYKDIHRPYGTMADHDALIKGLHDRGMKYVLDLVVNHTSDQHEWFKQSRSSKENPYRDWYYWRPARYDADGNRMPPNNWEAAFSGSAWEWDETTQEYYLHLFAVEQPDLNWENPKVVEAVHDIVRFWLDRGVDGFRMDVINFISKTFGLPDAPVTRDGFLQVAIEHFSCGPRLHEFLKGLGSILQEYDAFSVGEMPGVTDTREIVKGVGGDRGELCMAFQFELVGLDNHPGEKWREREFNVSEYKQVTNKWQRFMLENNGWNALYLENHDQGRSITRFASEAPEYRTISSKLIASNLVLQSGTPFVYQGQELAQINMPADWGIEYYKDIEALNYWKELDEKNASDDIRKAVMRQYRLIGRDNARTPVQWSSAKNAGFTAESTPASVKPWMPVHPDHADWNAAKQVKDPKSAFNYWRQILQLRKEYKDIFVYGDFEMLDMDHEFVCTYARTADKEVNGKKQALIISNFGGENKEGGKDGFWYPLPKGYGKFVADEAIVSELKNHDGKIETKTEGETTYVKLRPYEAIVALA
ncbi:hypothetical protein R6Q59_009838 [Mikania micrantha]